MELKIKVTFVEDTERLIGPGPISLLKEIDNTSSVKQATRNLNISYSKAWKLLEKMENYFGSLVIRETGGANGGSAILTDKAREIISLYENINSDLSKYIIKFKDSIDNLKKH